MTAQVATTTHNNPDTALAHVITMATLITETAVVIGTTHIRPAGISVHERFAAPCRWVVEVHADTPDDVDEIGRVFALPVIDYYSEQLYTRAWDGVSLAGHLVTVRVYSGRRA